MSNYSEALAFAAAFCSSAEHCKSEVLEKTSRFELEQEEQTKLIQHLQQESFIDENRYVKAFVSDRFRFNKWGRIKIRFMLRQKGISAELIEEGIRLISDDEYINTLLTLLKQKKPTVKSKNKYELREKMLRFGSGRGFEPSLISLCLKRMDIDEEEY
jgi:regulatory protein